MNLSPEQAAQSLSDVERTQWRSAELNHYRSAAPLFMLWGVAWMLGYGLSYFFPEYPWIWDASVPLWIGVAFVVRRRQGAQRYGNASFAWRFWAIAATIYLFLLATFAIFHPVNVFQVRAFIPIVFAAVYTVVGLWVGWRYSAMGVALGVLTVGGYFLLHAYFFLWMALVGGGTLLLTSFWLRRA